MSNKMTNCKTCGQEIASSAKRCPNCGAKAKKPIYKKWWFWVIIVIVISGIIAGASGDSDTPGSTQTDNTTVTSQSSDLKDKGTTEERTYTSYEVIELLDAVEANALKAKKDLKGQYIEVHGYLSDIDSSGNYISVGASKNNYDYFLKYIHCNIKHSNKEEITDKVLEMNIDEPIIVRGKVTDVGEVLGIYLDIDSIG